jgi:hypothetical protein
MRIVGVLPMAGSGSRLGLPFHKSLAPTFDEHGRIIPLYQHAYDRLSCITDEIVCVLSPAGDRDPCMSEIPKPVLVKTESGESPSSIALVASAYPGTWLAMVFPDSIWYPKDGLKKAVDVLSQYGDAIDGVLVNFRAPGNMLDSVITADGYVQSIIQKAKERTSSVEGWGAFIVKSEVAVDWDDRLYLSDNLERLTLRTVLLEGPYRDLGTPESYRQELHRQSEPPMPAS